MSEGKSRRLGDTVKGKAALHGSVDGYDASHVYKLRVGPNYKKHKRKEACTTSMYDLIGCDMFRF